MMKLPLSPPWPSLAGMILALFLVASPALAQTQAQSDAGLAQLSPILGALAHLEAICEEDGNSPAREDMQSVLDSEALSPLRQAVLIDAFNRGFRSVANTHQRCTSASLRLIARHHARGAAIVAQLLGEP